MKSSDVYEAGTTRLFQVLLKRGMTAVDVGAHIGYYTVLASRLVGEEGRVYAFEPDPNTFAILIENIKTKALPNVLPIQKAIADRIGDATLYLGKERIDRVYDSGWNSLYKSEETGADNIEIPVTTLDEFFAANGWPRVDLIKMDIQGAELAALEGARGLLSRSRGLKLILEFEPELVRAAGIGPEQFVDRLTGLTLTVRVINDEGLESLQLPNLLHRLESLTSVNLLCEYGG